MLTKDIIHAMAGSEFNAILAKDEVLLELKKKRFNKRDEFLSFVQLCDVKILVADYPVFPLTPLVFCYLWILDNAYVTCNKDITQNDTDVFMYILSRDLKAGLPKDFDPLNVNLQAKNFCKNHNLNEHEVHEDLTELLSIVFNAVNQLPKNLSSSKEVSFGVDWMVDLCSIVAKQTLIDVKKIMFTMSLTECYYYYVSFINQSGTKTYKPTDSEITKAILDRTEELGIQYFNNMVKENGN